MQIEIEEISKEFGATAALHPVSVSIPSGALVALLGPSGSGKTTLLRILGGLEFPNAGRVRFDGQGLCCTNRLTTGLPLIPGRLIPRPS
jgi:sulfate/thiosulfate transport system ATP-binding protein